MDMQTNPATSMAAPFAERYDNFIGGKWVAPKDGRYFDNISSVTGKPVGKIARSQAADVEAAREVKVGQTTTGIPVSEITVRSRVSYADLDLTSDAGVQALKDRIREAAAGACKEMNVRVPAEGSSVESCTRDAVKSAMVEADKVIAARRGAK